jgi:hypothetical protein
MAVNRLEVGGVALAGAVGVFAIGAVIVKPLDGNSRHEVRHTAHVVGVVVGDEQVIDAADACLVHGGLDALGVAAVMISPAGIDEQRCAGGRDQQRGLAAFDVDCVNDEVLGFGVSRCGKRGGRKQSGSAQQRAEQHCCARAAGGFQAAISRNSHLPPSVVDGAAFGEISQPEPTIALRIQPGERGDERAALVAGGGRSAQESDVCRAPHCGVSAGKA